MFGGVHCPHKLPSSWPRKAGGTKTGLARLFSLFDVTSSCRDTRLLSPARCGRLGWPRARCQSLPMTACHSFYASPVGRCMNTDIGHERCGAVNRLQLRWLRRPWTRENARGQQGRELRRLSRAPWTGRRRHGQLIAIAGLTTFVSFGEIRGRSVAETCLVAAYTRILSVLLEIDRPETRSDFMN
ncbi:hypothetical protein LZ30DRAFT_739051 [Colletotrichum cereale]|nr:hypothetical protein LZ30DRAFT_739051 [Colletotrichum cereale]